MVEWLQLFEIARFGRPVVLSVLLYGAIWTLTRVLRVRSKPSRTRTAGGLLLLISAVAWTAFVAIAVWYARDPRYYDFAEPTMPAVAWMFAIGKPLYPMTTAAERYAHIYGPLAFMPLGAAMRLFGGDLIVTKCVGAAAGIVSLFFVFAALRSHLTARASVLFTGYCALLLLAFRNAAFWSRPDSLELLCTSVAVWGLARARPFGWFAMGVTVGVFSNLKFSGPLYCVPFFVLLLERSRPRTIVLAFATAIIVAALPFIAFPNVSFHEYLSWIVLSARNGIVWSTLRQNLEWVVFLSAPFAAACLIAVRRQRTRAASRSVVAALVLAMGGVAVLASKPGAGPYHLLPFLPLVTFLTAMQMDRLRLEDVGILLPVTFTTVAVAITLAQQTSFISTVKQIDAAGPSADVLRFADSHPGAVIQIGYSSDERMTFVRPLLVFRSNTYLLDQPAIQEHQLAGIEIPDATERAFRSCAVTYWLIPKAGEPFSAVNRYPSMHRRPLFGSTFRQAFFDAYERSDRTDYFDVWTCHVSGARGASEGGR
jgi:hypothetical protein